MNTGVDGGRRRRAKKNRVGKKIVFPPRVREMTDHFREPTGNLKFKDVTTAGQTTTRSTMIARGRG